MDEAPAVGVRCARAQPDHDSGVGPPAVERLPWVGERALAEMAGKAVRDIKLAHAASFAASAMPRNGSLARLHEICVLLVALAASNH